MDRSLEHLFSRLSLRLPPPPPTWAPYDDVDGLSLGSKQESLLEYRGRILALARDPMGCRVLNAKIENGAENADVEIILSEVVDEIGGLAKDQSASQLVQRVIKACDERQRTRIVFSLCRTQFLLISVCLNPYGTRVIQKLLECVTSQQQVSLLISALSPGTVLLSVDPNGHHVIQHCLMRFSDQDNMHILSAISQNCFKIATSKSGCCVLQSCVEHCRGEYRELILADIIASAHHLAEDPYGNYVVQHLLGLKIPEIMENLVRQLQGSFLSLSCNKYASNVVEKFLMESSMEWSSLIIMELLRNDNVCLLLIHPYGNFVIQSALVASRGFVRNTLLALIRLNAPTMQTNHYGKKVLERLNKMVPRHV